MANKDTPEGVNVPPTWAGLITWALGRWGIGLLGFFFAYVVYSDLRHDTTRMFSFIETQTRVNAETVAALHALRQRIEETIYHINVDKKP